MEKTEINKIVLSLHSKITNMANKKFKYDVEVCRTSYSTRTITVEAANGEEAKQLALDAAGDLEFSEHSSDYSVESLSHKYLDK